MSNELKIKLARALIDEYWNAGDCADDAKAFLIAIDVVLNMKEPEEKREEEAQDA